MDFLVETALLTHGLQSISAETIRGVWQDRAVKLAWVDAGRVVIDDIEAYLLFRQRQAELVRIDCYGLCQAEQDGLSGALTASGTMQVCAREGVRVAVTCGMGGIGAVQGEELCPDLPALAELPVSLVSAGPKDMLARAETFTWLAKHGVKVWGCGHAYSTGYIFIGEEIALAGVYECGPILPPLLLINEIPADRRISDGAVLQEAIAAGKAAEAHGGYYHPAANARIDELTAGYSSRVQLAALWANAKLAASL